MKHKNNFNKNKGFKMSNMDSGNKKIKPKRIPEHSRNSKERSRVNQEGSSSFPNPFCILEQAGAPTHCFYNLRPHALPSVVSKNSSQIATRLKDGHL